MQSFLQSQDDRIGLIRILLEWSGVQKKGSVIDATESDIITEIGQDPNRTEIRREVKKLDHSLERTTQQPDWIVSKETLGPY